MRESIFSKLLWRLSCLPGDSLKLLGKRNFPIVRLLRWQLGEVMGAKLRGNKVLAVRETHEVRQVRPLVPKGGVSSGDFSNTPAFSKFAQSSLVSKRSTWGVVEIESGEVFHNSRFSSVIYGKSLLIPPRTEAPPWKIFKGGNSFRVGGVLGQHKSSIVFRPPEDSRFVPEVLYAGTRSPGNWYHWIANTLPAIFRANLYTECGGIPLVLPSELQSVPQIIESLELFRNGRGIEWLRQDQGLHASRVFWSTSPVYDSPYSSSAWNRHPHVADHELLGAFRDVVTGSLSERGPVLGGAEKLFLARRWGGRRCENQEQLIEISEGFGFKTVYCEELSFREQVQLFGQAKKVIGPMGAAFANLLFGSERLEAALFSGPILNFENYFQVLSVCSGAKVQHLIGEETDRASRSFWLPPETLEKFLIGIDLPI